VVIAARGVKPGDWLAARIREQGGHCTERNANLIIAGKQPPNARAILALNHAFFQERVHTAGTRLAGAKVSGRTTTTGIAVPATAS